VHGTRHEAALRQTSMRNAGIEELQKAEGLKVLVDSMWQGAFLLP
jgi:hypothetical protein